MLGFLATGFAALTNANRSVACCPVRLLVAVAWSCPDACASYWQIVTPTGWNLEVATPWPQTTFSVAVRTAAMVSGQSMLGVPLGAGDEVGLPMVVGVSVGWAAGGEMAFSLPQA